MNRVSQRASVRPAGAKSERDMELANALHPPEFHLITPGGISRSRLSYLAAVQAGTLSYLKGQAG